MKAGGYLHAKVKRSGPDCRSVEGLLTSIFICRGNQMNDEYEQTRSDIRNREYKFYITRIGIPTIFLMSILIGGCPFIKVFYADMSGRAKLAEAENGRKVLIEQAKAEKESAVMRADAIKIVGQAAKDFPEYRTQEFIGAFAEALKEGNVNQIMYVPTEANIPITEANRFSAK